MDKCCQGLMPNCVCNFCDICEEKVENEKLYSFDVVLRNKEEVAIQGCKTCIEKAHKDITGKEFPKQGGEK